MLTARCWGRHGCVFVSESEPSQKGRQVRVFAFSLSRSLRSEADLMDIPAREASVRAAPRLSVVCETQSARASAIGLRSFETWESNCPTRGQRIDLSSLRDRYPDGDETRLRFRARPTDAAPSSLRPCSAAFRLGGCLNTKCRMTPPGRVDDRSEFAASFGELAQDHELRSPVDNGRAHRRRSDPDSFRSSSLGLSSLMESSGRGSPSVSTTLC